MLPSEKYAHAPMSTQKPKSATSNVDGRVKSFWLAECINENYSLIGLRFTVLIWTIAMYANRIN
jgi:hypothetical protein